MKFSDQLTRIRRFLRDPDGDIWGDALLRRLFNDEARKLSTVMGIESIDPVRVPPRYGMSFTHDHEYSYADEKGYQALRLHFQTGWVCCYLWEVAHLNAATPSDTEIGYAYTHPWEGYLYSCNKQPPVWFPKYFEKSNGLFWDKKPLEYRELSDIQLDDPSWETRSGEPWAYTRRDSLSNDLYLYPRPSTNVWDETSGTNETGMVLDTSDDDSVGAETGTITHRSETLTDDDLGIATDFIRADDNLLVIAECHPKEIDDNSEETEFPEFIQKYAEYGVIAEGYGANTDGRIKSLADYWNWRKELGFEMVKKYKWNRISDRRFQLKTQDMTGWRNRRHARLPDEYPAVYP
jgi:hypothetical protein